MNRAAASDVRALFALQLLGELLPSEALGDVTLLPHQRDGVSRLRRQLHEHGGALLADDVGLGKTYMALAIAREATRAIVIAPAALRATWTASAATARVAVQFASVESLSHRVPDGGPFDLVIVDEAHHLRTARTRRFAAAVQLCRDARVLLMSATPVQNRAQDLRAILSLFLGHRAYSLDVVALSDYIVRRLERDLQPDRRPRIPSMAPIVTLPVIDDADCLARIVALPPPLPVAGGGNGGVLLTYSLVRQWSSSRAALLGALRRRLSRAHAMEDALLAGRHPTIGELRSWCMTEETQQLAFPELVVANGTPEIGPLLEQVRRHVAAVRELCSWITASADADVVRAERLRALRDLHPGARIVAFSEYADTVAFLYRLLARDSGVAMLTHAGARVAGGRLRRQDVLRQLGPSCAAAAHERVDLLLTTDLLSEGVDLQAASVVVHLDLTWNPARLEQRVGRLRRIGARNDSVHVYIMPPPAPAEQLLQLERRLRAKLGVAAATVGTTGTVLPRLAVAADVGAARIAQRIAQRIESWRGSRPAAAPALAAAYSDIDGAVACVSLDGRHQVVAVQDGQVRVAPDDVLRALERANGPDADIDAAVAEAMEREIHAWLVRRGITDVVRLSEIRLARARRSVLQRVDTIVRRTPRHTQSRLAPLMHAARGAASAPLSAGAEEVLRELASCALDDQAWLHAMREFAQLHAAPAISGQLVALLLLVRR